MRLHFKRNWMNRYEVTSGERGHTIDLGWVEKRIDHYNLARSVTVLYWIARTPDGRAIAEESDHPRSVHFRTRADAATALVAAKVSLPVTMDAKVAERLRERPFYTGD